MAYCLPDDIRGVLLPVGDSFNNTAASLTDPQLAGSIRDAEDLVNGYTGTEYDDMDVPPLIQTLTKHVAAYYATLTFRKNVELSQRDPVVLRFNSAVATLQAISQGLVNAQPYNEDQPGTAPDQVFVQNAYTGQLFGPRDFYLGPRGGRHGW